MNIQYENIMKKIMMLVMFLGLFFLSACMDAATRFWNGQPVFTERYHAKSDCEKKIEEKHCFKDHNECWDGDNKTLIATATKEFKSCMREKGYFFSKKP